MNWDDLFSKLILDRGKSYYKRGMVQNLHQWEQEYRAEVIGTRPYKVSVQMRSGKYPQMNCSCPYAKGGTYCKHMAALMYAVEGKKDSSREQMDREENRQVFPFAPQQEEPEHYRYFNMEKMTEKIVFTHGVLEQAKQLIEQAKVQMNKVELGYGKMQWVGNEIVGVAQGDCHIKNALFAVEASFDRQKFRYLYCQVSGCRFHYDSDYEGRWGAKQNCCSHVTALLLLLGEYLRKNNPGDATDRTAYVLLENYRSKQAKLRGGQPELSQKVFLEPKLEFDFEDIRLSFKVGTQKLYMVKNLTDLVETVEAGESYPLGKSGAIHFVRDGFEEVSEGYYRFIKNQVRMEQCRDENFGYDYRYGRGEEIKGSLHLYGERLDRFFELALQAGKHIEYKRKLDSRSGQLFLREKAPKIHLCLQKDVGENNIFDGVKIEGRLPHFWKGMDTLYYQEENFLNRVPQRDISGLEALLDTGMGEHVSFRIGRKNLTEFYHRILPAIAQNAEVEEPDAEDIQTFIPPEVQFIFYLDAEKDDIFCQANALYGEAEYSLTDWKDSGREKEELRDAYQEREMTERLLDFFPEVNTQKQQFFCGGNQDRVYRILDEGIDTLLSWGEVKTTDKFRRMTIRRKAKVSVGVSLGSELMDLSISSEDISQEELLEILYSYQRKKKYYRLRNGDFLNLEDQSIEELSAMMETLQISPKEFVKGKMQIPIYRALYLDKMLENSQRIYASRDSHFKKLVKEFKTVRDSDFELPEKLLPVMRNYQAFGFKWLKTLEAYGFGGILADDMGLGKTLQMISVLLAAKQEGRGGISLVVSPASLVYNWQEELNRFAPELSVCPVVGSQKERQEIIRDCLRWDVLVTSYDLLKRDVDCYEGRSFTYMVLDEAQYIKNHTTAAAKAVKVIAAGHRFALTGTPIENRLSELWSIFDFLMPGFLYNYETFRKDLEIPIAKNRDEEVTKRLKRMVSPFILRRKKADVLGDLPEKMEEIRYARFDESQQQLYDAQVVHMRSVLEQQSEEDFNRGKLQVLAELTKIRQICCDPTLLFADYPGESAKRQACMELIASAIEGEHKMLVFSQFTSMLELLEEDLKKENTAYYKITGQTSKEKRLELVNAFNRDDTPVFLISLKAGGTGLNLTGADIVIHYDPWWNLAAQSQATDRAHRIGQTKAVSVYKLIVKDTIEEKIVKMQEAKKDLAEEILSGETGGIVNMSRDDLLELL